MQTKIMFLNLKFFFAGYNIDYIKIEKKNEIYFRRHRYLILHFNF